MTDLGSALGDLLPAALGVAISPLPIIATVLMLLSQRARHTAPAFGLGWMAGIAAVMVVVLVVAGPDGIDTGSSTDLSSWIKLALGLVFLLLGWHAWRTRPRPGREVVPPKWMASLDTVSPAVAFGLGAALAGLNPKNLALAMTGAVAVASAGLSTTQNVVCVVIFVLIGSLLIAGPVVAFLVAGDRMTASLEGLKSFLEDHTTAIMLVLFSVLGLSDVGKGLGGLLG